MKNVSKIFSLCVIIVFLAAWPSLSVESEVSSSFCGEINLVLPEVIYATAGVESNVYFDNTVLVVNPDNFIFDVTCAKGSQQNERWTYKPTDVEAGEYPFLIEVRDQKNKVIAKANSTVVVSNIDANESNSVTMLCIGDSLTSASSYTGHFLTLCKESQKLKVTLIGSHDPRDSQGINIHEGYGGWTAERFITHYTGVAREGDRRKRGSPFLYKDTQGEVGLDFDRYCEEFNNGKSPDVVTIFLGCNDVFGATDENIDACIDTMIKYYDQLIQMICDSSEKTKIGLLLPVPPAAKQDAFGENYKNGQTRWQYKRNQHALVKKIIAEYGNNETGNIFIVPANVNLDCVNNYPRKTAKCNGRSSVDITRLHNGVHPAGPGYRQIGDTIFCWLASQF